MNKFFAIKGPDGRLHTQTAAESMWLAWSNAKCRIKGFPYGGSHSTEAIKRRGMRAGYRCVEVEIVEAGAVCEWRKGGFGSRVSGCANIAYVGTENDGWKFCPHCGRKIVKKNADGGEKGES